MYWTIWAALALFAAGDIGRQQSRRWAWWAWAIGVTLATVHIALAMAVVHDWSHARAMAATARTTNEVFGLDWGGGVYANYLFIAVWLAETVWWRVDPGGYTSRPAWATWTSRTFYLVMILNAAVIFAAGARRWIGAAIVAILLVIWCRDAVTGGEDSVVSC